MARKIGGIRNKINIPANHWEDYLDAGEHLIWQGQPATGLKFSGAGLMLPFFGLFFLGFSLFWVSKTNSIGGGGSFGKMFPLFGLPFVLMGLWLVVAHWFFDAYKRIHARHALTNTRALIARSMFGRQMESYPIDRHSAINLISGDLDTVNFAQETFRTTNSTGVRPVGFRFIEDGQEVFDLLRKIKDEDK